MQVHEAAGAQQAIDHRLPRGVAAHQPLHGPRLVRSEVIDVHAGIQVPSLQNRVHQGLEAPALRRPVERPVVMVARRADLERQHPGRRRVRDRPAEQVLDSALVHVGIPLEVEEQVAGRGIRQTGEPAAGRQGKQLVQAPALGPAGELDARLLSSAAVALLRAARRLPGNRQRLVRQGREPGDLARLELTHLQPRDPGD